MGGPGPMLGQVHHFVKYNPGKAPYAEERYLKEAHRLYGVLNKRLDGREYRRRRLFDRRHRDLAVDLALRVADHRPEAISERAALVSRDRQQARRRRRATRCPRTSARCRSRSNSGRNVRKATRREPRRARSTASGSRPSVRSGRQMMRKAIKIVHEGKYAAEIPVELIEDFGRLVALSVDRGRRQARCRSQGVARGRRRHRHQAWPGVRALAGVGAGFGEPVDRRRCAAEVTGGATPLLIHSPSCVRNDAEPSCQPPTKSITAGSSSASPA